MSRARKPEVAPSLIQRVLDDIEAFTPAEGANLVGIDRFEAPGEAA